MICKINNIVNLANLNDLQKVWLSDLAYIDITEEGYRKILDGYTFEQTLDMCLNMQYEKYAKKLGRCQSKTFLLVRKNDNKIIGTINIRWNLTEAMKQFGGNIGYGIRPLERRKGYNKINLYLGLIEAKN